MMTATTTAGTLADYTGSWDLDPSHTRIGFSARHAMVTTVRGQFGEFSGHLTLDGSAPADSVAELTVQTASIDTGNTDRDAHLRSGEFLDVDSEPTMTFHSTAVRADRSNFVLLGDLTIRGTTRPVEIVVEPTGVATDPFGNVRAGFEGRAVISRKDFGLTWNVALEAGGVLVSDKVTIVLDVSAIRQA
jgi:polyisoprenoid-binding protein YceI